MAKKCAQLENICTFSVALISILFFIISFLMIIMGIVSIMTTAGLEDVIPTNLFYFVIVIGFGLLLHSILGILTAMYEIRIIEMTFSIISLILFLLCLGLGYMLTQYADKKFVLDGTLTESDHMESDKYKGHVNCVFKAACEEKYPGDASISVLCDDFSENVALYETSCWLVGCIDDCGAGGAGGGAAGTEAGFKEEYDKALLASYGTSGNIMLIVAGLSLLATIGGIIDWLIFEQDGDDNTGVAGKVCDCCDSALGKCKCLTGCLENILKKIAGCLIKLGACSVKVLPWSVRVGLATAASIAIIPTMGFIVQDAPSYIKFVLCLGGAVMVLLLFAATLLRPSGDSDEGSGLGGRNRLVIIALFFTIVCGGAAMAMNTQEIEGFSQTWSLGIIFVILGGVGATLASLYVCKKKGGSPPDCSKLCCCCKKDDDN